MTTVEIDLNAEKVAQRDYKKPWWEDMIGWKDYIRCDPDEVIRK